MSLKHGILGFIKYGVDTGYELNKTFRVSVDHFWHATSSQIYRELAWLETNGMVTGQEQIQTGKPNKKLYYLTEEGERELSKWLASDTPDVMRTRNAFLVKVFFSGLQTPEETLRRFEMFDRQCEEMAHQTEAWGDSIARYKEQMEDSDQSFFWEMTSDYGKRYLDMCREWSAESKRRLRERMGEESCGE